MNPKNLQDVDDERACAYCGTPLDEGEECECDGARIAALEAEVARLHNAGLDAASAEVGWRARALAAERERDEWKELHHETWKNALRFVKERNRARAWATAWKRAAKKWRGGYLSDV